MGMAQLVFKSKGKDGAATAAQPRSLSEAADTRVHVLWACSKKHSHLSHSLLQRPSPMQSASRQQGVAQCLISLSAAAAVLLAVRRWPGLDAVDLPY
jgi:hypothetical protein